jgi:molecular chaperone Hsp33
MFDEFDIEYLCTCNRDKYLRALVGLSEDDMDELRQSNEPVETNCRFCGQKYVFDLDELNEARAAAKEASKEDKE